MGSEIHKSRNCTHSTNASCSGPVHSPNRGNYNTMTTKGEKRKG